jgi:hypothetical protein
MQSQFLVSQKSMENATLTRKRQSNPEEWRDRAAKIKKDAGEEYESRNGFIRPALDPPAGVILSDLNWQIHFFISFKFHQSFQS